MKKNQKEESPQQQEKKTKQELRRRIRKDVSRILLTTAIFILALFLLKNDVVREHLFNRELIRQDLRVDTNPVLSVFLFLTVGSILNAVGMPRLWVSTVAGFIYGAVFGTLWSLIAAVIGSLGTYMLGRSLLRSVVRRRLGKKMGVWLERFQENAFMWILYARFFPVSNATLTSLICGCCKVPKKAFLLANTIGFFPLTLVFAIFGSAAGKGKPEQMFLGFLFFCLLVIGQWIYTRFTKRRLMKRLESDQRDEGPQQTP